MLQERVAWNTSNRIVYIYISPGLYTYMYAFVCFIDTHKLHGHTAQYAQYAYDSNIAVGKYS